MKKIATVFLWIFIFCLVLFLGKDMILKTAVEKGVGIVTGLKLSIQSFHFGIADNQIHIKGLKLYNPPSFSDSVMVDLPEIFVNYDLPAIMKGNIHLREIRIDLQEFSVAKNANGQLNIDSLKTIQEQKKSKSQPAQAKQPEAKKQNFKIDVLELKVGKATYKDYSRGSASALNFDLNLNERYENVTNPNALVSLIVFKVLTSTTIGRLTNFNVGDLENVASDTLRTGQKLLTNTASTAMNQTTKAISELEPNALKGTMTGTTATLKETAGNLKQVIKLPFGTKKTTQ